MPDDVSASADCAGRRGDAGARMKTKSIYKGHYIDSPFGPLFQYRCAWIPEDDMKNKLSDERAAKILLEMCDNMDMAEKLSDAELGVRLQDIVGSDLHIDSEGFALVLEAAGRLNPALMQTDS